MRYVSTRGQAEARGFLAVALAGLAPDGGLYVPVAYPELSPPEPGESYIELASRILSAFASGSMAQGEIAEHVKAAYSGFASADIVALKELEPDLFLLELHHGPSLAFKDIAMRFLARLYAASGHRPIILCATSGDTGGAAAMAFAGLPVELVILHPHERISPRQRLFMTTSGADNIHNLALEGDFDVCQAIVKQLFADRELAPRLSGVNSINWVRIAAQSVYYAWVQAALGVGRKLRFVVPTGNFGDGLAAFVACESGLLAELDCVLAVNDNDAMACLLRGETLPRRPALATPSPAMDIQLPSNFERLLYAACEEDAGLVRSVYLELAQTGLMRVPEQARANFSGFSAYRVGSEQTLEQMRKTWQRYGELVCPHTAVALAAAEAAQKAKPVSAPTIVLATAHAAKFPETVAKATGCDPSMPAHAAILGERREIYQTGPADIGFVREFIAGL